MINVQEIKDFPDLKIVTLPVYRDNRGFFTETFRPEVESALGVKFLQDNHSFSARGVIRGIHFQWDSPMGKLIRVVSGSIMDVAVDLRPNSKTFGKYHAERLDASENKQFWVPSGFGHAFLALEDNTNVTYKCSAVHNASAESCINPLDMDLNINWPIDKENLILSKKDMNASSFAEYKINPKF